MWYLLGVLLSFALLQSSVLSRKLDQRTDAGFLEICSNRNGVNIPMPGSCTGFFICVDGNAIASSCGSFYHFNTQTGLCDHPLKANCQLDLSQIKNITSPTNEKKQGTRSSLPKPKTPAEVVADLSIGPICKNLPTGTLLPKSDSCSQYYVCILERPYRRTCPPMLHFNATRGLCQDPTMAKCSIQSKKITKKEIKLINTVATNLKEYDIANLDELGNTDSTKMDTICIMSPNGTLFPFQDDCNRFIFCINHQALALICPEGHHFSVRNGRCEWPSIAKCQSHDW
ncbi:probable chitinase 10 [Bactrocera dorsalis]|uniref:Probable chitinase 10 n=1 Tax=Bactrocera dorsalis TaxID=27457 RepID=A0A6I9VMI9_BACDO|nr:probable chitinase 10 [Bactrocera dorsalis]